MRNRILEHPEVTRALATGYPRPIHAVRCTSCCAEVFGDKPLYRYRGGSVCARCFRSELLEDHDLDALAEAFDIERVTAGELAEMYPTIYG